MFLVWFYKILISSYDLLNLKMVEFLAGFFYPASLNKPALHSLIACFFVVNTKKLCYLAKQCEHFSPLSLAGRNAIFDCCVCVCHMFLPPRRRSPDSDFFSASHQPALLLDHATTMIRKAGCQLPITRFRICNLCRFLNPNIRNYSGCRISGCNCSRTLRNLWRGQFSP